MNLRNKEKTTIIYLVRDPFDVIPPPFSVDSLCLYNFVAAVYINGRKMKKDISCTSYLLTDLVLTFGFWTQLGSAEIRISLMLEMDKRKRKRDSGVRKRITNAKKEKNLMLNIYYHGKSLL